MKNFQLSEKLESKPSVSDTFEREKVIKAFRRMGFIVDYEARYVSVLRNSNFPFQRIVLPSIESIDVELLELHANDLGFPVSHLIDLINR
jgi:hypothetical protein